MVDWICERDHTWTSRIDHRMRNNGTSAGRATWTGFNDVATLFPHLVEEWHPIKNFNLGWTLTEITAKSDKKSWWQCSDGHEWQVAVRDKVKKDYGCGSCKSQEAVSSIELAVREVLEAQGIECQSNVRGPLGRNQYELDILFEINGQLYAIEVNGGYWHSTKFKDEYFHLTKYNLAKENSINLIFIWEHQWNNSSNEIIKQLNFLLNDIKIEPLTEKLTIYAGTIEEYIYVLRSYRMVVSSLTPNKISYPKFNTF